MNDYDELVACLQEQVRLKTLWEECEKDNRQLEAENERLRRKTEVLLRNNDVLREALRNG